MSQELGEIYLARFRNWRDSMSDADFRQIVYTPRGNLNRQQVKKLAGLSDEAIKRNGGVKRELKQLEDDLRRRVVLPPLTESGEKSQAAELKPYDKTARKAAMDSQRVAQLESSNHDLKVRVSELEKEVEELRSKLASSKETVEAVNDGLVVFTQCSAN